MGFGNTVQKLTEKLLGTGGEETVERSLPSEADKSTITIDLPELPRGSKNEEIPERLGDILNESELEHQKRLAKLKDSVGSGAYGVDSEKIANSILKYPKSKD